MLKVLIVDDSNFMRKNLAQLFTGMGHQVAGEAENGEEAVSLYNVLKPDLVTMDVTMPKMEGIEAVKRIVAGHPDAKIIMVSAQSQRDVVYDAIQAGALTFLAKPVKSENVVKVLNKVFPRGMAVGPKTTKYAQDFFFKVEFEDSHFTVSITREPGGYPVDQLHTAVSGLLYVSPLVVDFNYEKVEALPKEVFELIAHDYKRVNAAGGTAHIISNAPKKEEEGT